MSDCVVLHGKSEELASTVAGPINLICTDPPYGMDFQSNFAVTEAGKSFAPKIANDGDLDHAVDVFYQAVDPFLPNVADEADMYVFCRWSLIGEWVDVVKAVDGFTVKNILIWDKGTPGMGDLDANWGYSFECIIYAKKGRRPISNGRRSSIIRVDRMAAGKNFHPSQKPVQLLEELIAMSTDRGDLVVDPFAGSGSTIIAARNLGRRGVGIEMEKMYVDRANEQLERPMLDLGI